MLKLTLVAVLVISFTSGSYGFNDLTSYITHICADREVKCPQVFACFNKMPEMFLKVKDDCLLEVGGTKDEDEFSKNVMCHLGNGTPEKLRKCALTHKDVIKYSLNVDDAVVFIKVMNCLRKIDVPISK